MNNDIFLQFCEFDKNFSERFVGHLALSLFYCLYVEESSIFQSKPSSFTLKF